MMAGAAALCYAPALIAEPAPQPAPGDWATYGHDAGGQRHSALGQIGPANVANLVPAWTYHMKPAPAATPAAAPKDANADAQRVAEGLGGAPSFHHARFAGSEIRGANSGWPASPAPASLPCGGWNIGPATRPIRRVCFSAPATGG